MIFGVAESGEGAGDSECQLFTGRLTITLYPPLLPGRLRKQSAAMPVGRNVTATVAASASYSTLVKIKGLLAW
jgi:hypothetical protein